MKNKNLLILILAFVLILGIALFLYTRLGSSTEPGQLSTQPAAPSEGTEPPKVPAQDFTVYDADGKAVKLSDFRGKPVVLNFWSSNCGPCKIEMPHFQDAFDAHGEEIHFLMVNMTDGSWDTKQSADSFIESNGYTFPVYYDSDMSAAIAYGIRALPTTFFIDSEGYAVGYAGGAISADILQQGISMITQ